MVVIANHHPGAWSTQIVHNSNSQESNDDLDIVPMFRNIDARSAAA